MAQPMYNSYAYALPTQKDIVEAKTSIMKCIRSNQGMTISMLTEEYQRQMGEVIPFFRIGYLSVFHMLRDIPEIEYASNEQGETVLVVPDHVDIDEEPAMETNEGLSRKRRLPYPPQGSPQSSPGFPSQTLLDGDGEDGASSAKKSRVIAVPSRRRFAERAGPRAGQHVQFSRG